MRRAVLGAVAAGLVLAAAPAARGQEEHVVEVIELDDVIDPVSADYLARNINEAAEAQSEAIVIQLDTPGGLDVSMRDMVQSILDSPVPVIVWVGPPGARAASAGVFLVYASHIAAMAPATNLGAAHPVDLGGGLSPVQEEKAVNDAAALLRSLADRRGRSVDFADAAVRESEAITETEAKSLSVIEVIAPSIPDLLIEVDGMAVGVAGGETRTLVTRSSAEDTVTLRFREPGLGDRILHAVASPTVAYLLLVLGFWALIFELSQPGVGIAGIAGVIALILAFYSLAVLPVNIAGLLLVLLGLAFFTIDVYTAGLGIFTIGGTISLAVGSLLLFAGVEEAIRVPIWVIVLVVVGSALFLGFAMTLAMRARRATPISGQEGMIGMIGESRADLSPEGQVWLKGALWRARALNGPIPTGRRVRVRRVDGLLLLVQEEKEETNE